MRVRHIIALLAVAALAYLLLWPTDFAPVAFAPAAPPAWEGALAVDDALTDVPTLGTVGEEPEDIAVDADGKLYTGLRDGHLMTFTPGAKDWFPLTVTYGRPLGLAFSPDDRWLYIADAVKGLMRCDKQGHLERLVDTLNGRDLGLVDDVAVAADGRVYFTTATTDYAWDDYETALLEHRGTGKLLRYDPQAKELTLLLDDLQFANGVAITPDQRAVLVAETGNYRILRYDLARGEATPYADNLPGFPDGLNYDDGGLLWVSLPSRRNALLDRLGPHPFLRGIVDKLPPGLKPETERYGLTVALDRDGRAVESLHDPTGRFAGVSNTVWRGDTAYLGSILGREVGVFVR